MSYKIIQIILVKIKEFNAIHCSQADIFCITIGQIFNPLIVQERTFLFFLRTNLFG
jgi:hypothetical protein